MLPVKKEILSPFVTSAVNILQMMAQVNPTVGEVTEKADKRTWGVVTGIIGMTGDKLEGNLSISFDEGSVLKIVGSMLMTELTQVDAEVIDAVGEIANMLCGGAKVGLHELGYEFQMASPVMISGKDVALSQFGKVPVAVIPLTIPEGQLVIEIAMRERAGAK
ncbi:MAG: chemotaxis protein CheX [Deltaproteobacteria bacterium]|nr:chemotaxis protein CheX [Deltaproteobacteria bacterium]